MSEWQPIETAPKDGRQILVDCFSSIHGRTLACARWHERGDPWLMPSGSVVLEGRNDISTWYCGVTDSGVIATATDATHWMPLPTPPSIPTEKDTR